MESGIEPSVDLDTLDERIKIREMILKGQIQEAIALINSLHPELLDTNRYLYFHLQVCTLWSPSSLCGMILTNLQMRKFIPSLLTFLLLSSNRLCLLYLNKKENLTRDLICSCSSNI